MAKFVYDYSEGGKDDKDLLGGKGANLAEMTTLGLPVPPGFIISTDACRAYLKEGQVPAGFDIEVREHLARLQKTMGKQLGDPDNPLLVAVRSGAKVSMPGMMETVLNVGLNDVAVHGLAQASGDERFAWDSYRRLLHMFGVTVLGVEGSNFSAALDGLKTRVGATNDTELTATHFQELVAAYQEIILEQTGHPFPQDPRDQLDLAIRAVFDSWNTDRARLYRQRERIPDELGTAVTVIAMVFGNLGEGSGTGVAFTRDPATGAHGVYGDYLENAQGEDVVAGIRNTLPLAELERLDKPSYDELMHIMLVLESHYKDMCDIEFTIERGKLWMLQTRVGKRTAAAAFRLAHTMVQERLIPPAEALRRVSGEQLAQLMFPRFVDAADQEVLAVGMGASPGAAVGKAVFDSATAVAWAERGEKVILVRSETTPDDLSGMVAAEGILTSRGGKTSHAAVVARGMGRTCVCGTESLEVDVDAAQFTTAAGVVVRQGEVISIDGMTGEVFAGAVPVTASQVVRYFEGELGPADDEVVAAVAAVMGYAQQYRQLGVRANADTPADAARSRRFGATGIGLCRTEHMFFGEDRRQLVENLIIAADEQAQSAALDALLPLQRADFAELFAAMDGHPVTIRLLDPPLHEFLPDLTQLSIKVARQADAGAVNERDQVLLEQVQRLHEQNPMLGLRGVRLGIVIPGLFAMQARAILEAAADCRDQGGSPQPEIMVPLVASVRELNIVRDHIQAVAAEVAAARGEVEFRLGTMIEVPRAAFLAHHIAQTAEFFSFGTNDLTQLTWGFSRDDVEGSFFSTYLASAIFDVSPFESLDTMGVGALVEEGTRKGRQVRPGLPVGVCGEHGGDPRSIHFFHQLGLDYVSCSPFRVPVALLEAGRAAVTDAT